VGHFVGHIAAHGEIAAHAPRKPPSLRRKRARNVSLDRATQNGSPAVGRFDSGAAPLSSNWVQAECKLANL
jgi:hypothetical protein